MPVNILIADDHAIVRHGTTLLLKEIFPDAVIYQANDLQGALDILRKQVLDLFICDLNMPGGDNLGLIDAIRRIQMEVKILIFSAYSENLYAIRYLKAGANGYLDKNCAEEEEVKEAILTVVQKGTYYSKNIQQQIADQQEPHAKKDNRVINELSNRETEVALLLIQGLGLLEISNHLKIGISTASTYKTRLYEKLKVTNVAELIHIFKTMENSLVQL